MKFYSQFGQDAWLYNRVFKHKKSGTFIEIGADDGIDKSNTKFFEELGWNGICIEPSPVRFKQLISNRNCICENFAISDVIGEIEFMDIKGWGKGLSGLTSKYSDEHLERIKIEIKHPNNNGHNLIKVKSTTLETILDKHDIKHIDFCSIDTEGCELDIIKTINFNNIKIDIILVENNYESNDVRQYLKMSGYKMINRLYIDDVYQRIF
jgi:FkbM family methyltransferase